MRRVRDIYICNFRRNDGCVCCLAVSSACFKIEVLLKIFEAQQNLRGDLYSSSMSAGNNSNESDVRSYTLFMLLNIELLILYFRYTYETI